MRPRRELLELKHGGSAGTSAADMLLRSLESFRAEIHSGEELKKEVD